MKSSTVISVLIATIGIILFTTLLVTANIGDASYVILVGMLVLTCIAIPVLTRLRELDLRSLKLTLERIEAVKAGIEELYGGIEHLRQTPLILDKVRMESLGLRTGSLSLADAGMRYTAGCIRRELERLARIFVNDNTPERTAAAILDGTMDDLVFKWNGPEVPLDQPPTSVDKRNMAANKAGGG
ncbi:MAG TPA: hypothetical protein VGY55_06860 [Pirellulales bacterium]|jgi:hypothetical protein|nr:hypothetical protein [Pirellulales bacterium]